MADTMDAGRSRPWLDPPEWWEVSARQGGKRRLHYDEVAGDYLEEPPTHKRCRIEYPPLTPSPDPPYQPNNVFFTISKWPSPERGFGLVEGAIEAPSPEPPFPSPPACLIAKDDISPVLEPRVGACAMEKTRSGLSICSDSAYLSSHESPAFDPDADRDAALRVKEHMSRSRRDTKGQRILQSLIRPKSVEADFPLDGDALGSIFSAGNETFFFGKLSQRVRWDWSHDSSSQYNSRIIGTTNLRKAKRGGYECLIVLSSPILRNTRYNRKLLISTFLHELIHCYLFVCNGFQARHCGGHTDGFREIARLIDRWAGRGVLHLCDMEADLEHFREVERSPMAHRDDDSSPCQSATYDGGSWDRGTHDRQITYPDSKMPASHATSLFFAR
ncbi:hypothetical protein NKR23_g2632 [Pleurostoma richardsiae]|uniref:SprT-like domain-containing protein n=1 Tax=Pleurostoma richardsiae TaxID=41990 RepID=A0AA38S1R4_9PEZI|nr:hypothetical protein NKR23_g2632 [Pleurostoma richardsiae]